MQTSQILHKSALKTLAPSQKDQKPKDHIQQLTLTSSSTLHRSRYMRSQISSGYIATRLQRHQGHSARSQVAHFDEFIYSGQVTLPEESDQLRLQRYQGHSARSQVAHFDEFIYSGQVTLPEESDQLRLHCYSATAPGAQQLTLTSSSTLDRSRYLRSQISSGYIATRPQRPEPSSSL